VPFCHFPASISWELRLKLLISGVFRFS